MTDLRPLAPDVRFVLEHVRSLPIARGIPVDKLGPVCFGIAMDARIRLRIRAASAEEREDLESLRALQQFTTRTCLYGAGLLPIHQVEPIPRDESGRDVQLSEWFPVPTAGLMAVAAAYLARLDEEAGEDA